MRVLHFLLGNVLFLALPGLTALLSPAVAAKTTDDLDRIAVIVNDDVITRGEIEARLPMIKQQLTLQRIQPPSDEVLQKQVLERMIMERIQLQLAGQMGIKATENQVDQAILNLAKQNQMDVKQFTDALQKQGVAPAKFREQIRAEITLQQLFEREISDRVFVSESEVNTFLAGEKDPAADAEYHLSHIFIALPDKAGADAIETARRRAEDLSEKLRQGADFRQLAIAHSQDQSALRGGELGWRRLGQLPPLFSATLKKLATGAYSEILRGPRGFHILKLNDKRGGDQPYTITQTHARHILIRTNPVVPLSEAERRIRQLRERIQNGEDFAALARANSDDPGSAANGGDLGWLNPGQAVPEFERAMDALKPNELSEPIATPFGVHLVQLLGRRQQDVSRERMYNNARRQIHARKADERYEQWLRQLRDEAYVEYPSNTVN